MLKRLLFGLAAGAVILALAQLLLANWLISGALAAISIPVFAFFVLRPLSIWRNKSRKREECFRFVNAFVVSYAVNDTIEASYASAAVGLSQEGKEAAEALASRSVYERLEGLAAYFETPFYRMFLSLLKVQQEEGGNFMDKAEPLLNEINQSYDDHLLKEKEKSKQLGQWAALWIMSALVVLFVRIALNNNYASIAASLPYIVIGVAYFLLIFVGFAIFAARLAETPLFRKGDSDAN